MSILEIQVINKKAAEKILSDVYQADNSATWAGDAAVSGSVLTGVYQEDKGVVRITSNYYAQYSLEEMFSEAY